MDVFTDTDAGLECLGCGHREDSFPRLIAVDSCHACGSFTSRRHHPRDQLDAAVYFASDASRARWCDGHH